MLVNFHRECIGNAKKSPVGPSHKFSEMVGGLSTKQKAWLMLNEHFLRSSEKKEGEGGKRGGGGRGGLSCIYCRKSHMIKETINREEIDHISKGNDNKE